MKKLKKIEVNKLVLKSNLPVAFYNSEIEHLNNIERAKKPKRIFIKRYQQTSIPRANPNKLISKIYELY